VHRLIAGIDRVSERSGQLAGWLILILIGALSWEVLARYGFDAPTSWAYDVAYMLYSSLSLLGAAYTLRRGGHIRTDFIYNALSPRARGLVDVIGYVLALPALALFIVAMGQAAWHSWLIREKAESAWRPPLYPLKWMIVLASVLLLLQAVAELARALHAAAGGRGQ
jgi:TRAP-type mannitol/chloroaromatic compound transport system permease small subunit